MEYLAKILDSSRAAEVILYLMAALLAFQAIVKLIDWFREKWGFVTKSEMHEKQQQESIDCMKKDINQIKLDQENYQKEVRAFQEETVDMRRKVMTEISGLKESVDNMQKKSDMNKAAELKDRIGQAYRYYHQIGKINVIEKEALKDLIKAYSQFSDNSFVHSLVEKEMETWEVIDNQ